MPHDVDIKALTRLATLYNMLFAVNQATRRRGAGGALRG